MGELLRRGRVNIGNRKTAQKDVEAITYEANEPYQYTDITTGEASFIPEYDWDSNQTKIRSGASIWTADYSV